MTSTAGSAAHVAALDVFRVAAYGKVKQEDLVAALDNLDTKLWQAGYLAPKVDWSGVFNAFVREVWCDRCEKPVVDEGMPLKGWEV
jgi:hypothetical protein